MGDVSLLDRIVRLTKVALSHRKAAQCDEAALSHVLAAVDTDRTAAAAFSATLAILACVIERREIKTLQASALVYTDGTWHLDR